MFRFFANTLYTNLSVQITKYSLTQEPWEPQTKDKHY